MDGPVSNLFSGVALLLDKSIKPGDIIEVGGTYGWVSSLGARYVAVETRDGTEYLIPNEDIITHQVINWSHNDERVRLKVPVRVPHDSDLDQVIALMREAATHPHRILSSPAHRPRADLRTGKTDLPGYYLKNTVLTDYDAAGAATIRIEAARIDQIAQTPEVALHDVRVEYLGGGGQNWVMFGDDARVPPGGKVVEVFGNVRLQSEAAGAAAGAAPAAVVRTDSLTYDVTGAVASTKGDVRIDFGAQTLSARGLVANLKERTMRLESKVNGRFHP